MNVQIDGDEVTIALVEQQYATLSNFVISTLGAVVMSRRYLSQEIIIQWNLC